MDKRVIATGASLLVATATLLALLVAACRSEAFAGVLGISGIAVASAAVTTLTLKFGQVWRL